MKVYVTGSNGYLGGDLLLSLERHGHEYWGMDSHGRNYTSSGRWDAGDKLGQADAVVHLAWYTQAGDGEPDIQRQCLEQTRRLVDSLGWWQRLIFLSTVTVYGNTDRWVDESSPPEPGCCYSKAKLEAEEHIRGRVKDHAILRSSSLMGLGVLRTKTQLAVNSMARDGWSRRRIEVWNPESWKPVIHVRDAAEVVVRAVTERWEGTYDMAAWNYRAIDIAAMVAEITGAVIVEVPDGSGPRSCRVAAKRMWKRMKAGGGERKWGGVGDAVAEMRGFEESEGDRNLPERWGTK